MHHLLERVSLENIRKNPILRSKCFTVVNPHYPDSTPIYFGSSTIWPDCSISVAQQSLYKY